MVKRLLLSLLLVCYGWNSHGADSLMFGVGFPKNRAEYRTKMRNNGEVLKDKYKDLYYLWTQTIYLPIRTYCRNFNFFINHHVVRDSCREQELCAFTFNEHMTGEEEGPQLFDLTDPIFNDVREFADKPFSNFIETWQEFIQAADPDWDIKKQLPSLAITILSRFDLTWIAVSVDEQSLKDFFKIFLTDKDHLLLQKYRSYGENIESIRKEARENGKDEFELVGLYKRLVALIYLNAWQAKQHIDKHYPAGFWDYLAEAKGFAYAWWWWVLTPRATQRFSQ